MTTFRWRNFHGFRDTGPLSLKPITILLGPNNSGKTSLFLPLLILKQSLDAEAHEPVLASLGPIVNAGGFRDLAHLGDEEAKVRFTLDHSSRIRAHNGANCDHPFHYPPGTIDVTFKKDPTSTRALLEGYTLRNLVGQHMLTRRRQKQGRYGISGMNFGGDEPRSRFDEYLRHEIRRDQPHSFLFSSAGATVRATRKSFAHDNSPDPAHEAGDEPETPRDVSSTVGEYLSATDFEFAEMHRLLGSTHYLGPVRSPAQRHYTLSPTTPSSVGRDGQKAAEMLFLDGKENRSLTSGVQEWLQHFGFHETLYTKWLGEDSYSLYYCPRQTSQEINYADMGFGLSQLLPLVVESQLCGKGHTFITEQPEIHLNPKLQSGIADLMVDTAERGASVIVETHSEHILLRLRRLIAEERLSADSVALYFVEREGGHSSLRSVPIKEDGDIEAEAWPKDFFGDALGESMALALAQTERKRHASRAR